MKRHWAVGLLFIFVLLSGCGMIEDLRQMRAQTEAERQARIAAREAEEQARREEFQKLWDQATPEQREAYRQHVIAVYTLIQQRRQLQALEGIQSELNEMNSQQQQRNSWRNVPTTPQPQPYILRDANGNMTGWAYPQ